MLIGIKHPDVICGGAHTAVTEVQTYVYVARGIAETAVKIRQCRTGFG